jgi:hypothetical protein
VGTVVLARFGTLRRLLSDSTSEHHYERGADIVDVMITEHGGT